jgi:hypothetical protein
MRPNVDGTDLGFAHRIGQAAKTGATDTETATPKMLATRRRSRSVRSSEQDEIKLSESGTGGVTSPPARKSEGESVDRPI